MRSAWNQLGISLEDDFARGNGCRFTGSVYGSVWFRVTLLDSTAWHVFKHEWNSIGDYIYIIRNHKAVVTPSFLRHLRTPSLIIYSYLFKPPILPWLTTCTTYTSCTDWAFSQAAIVPSSMPFTNSTNSSEPPSSNLSVKREPQLDCWCFHWCWNRGRLNQWHFVHGAGWYAAEWFV